MSQRIKVVHYLPNLVNGGIESMLLNYYKELKNDFEFVVIIHAIPSKSCVEKFEDLGIKIYQIPHWTKGLRQHHKKLKEILIQENPLIFQTHHNLNNFIPCFTAKSAHVSIRISHCHNYLPKKSWKQKVYSWFSRIFATDLAACGIGAATFLTNTRMVQKEKVKIIYNAIDISKFLFDFQKRNELRKKYHWENQVIYGNVGRFAKQKNQLFLIDLFEEISKVQEEARFLIIGGTGTEYEALMRRIDVSTIKEKITILKDISNVNDFYQAMDCFLLPSLFEGFAVTLIEAQISHLPCLISDTITKELESNTLYSLPLSNVESWVSTILQLPDVVREKPVDDKLLQMFDIHSQAKDLKMYYNNLIERRSKL